MRTIEEGKKGTGCPHIFRLTWRRISLEPLRTIITLLALGAVIAVILVLRGFEQGQYYQLSRIVINRQGDLVATQAGVSNFIAVRSSIPQISREAVESVDGVINAHPMTAIGLIYEEDGIRTPVYLVVYDTLGGPYKILEGEEVKEERDIVIDSSLADKYGLEVGDEFIVYNFAFKVSGISDGEVAFMMPFAYTNYDSMIELFFEAEIAPDISTFPLLSFMLIELDQAADREVVAAGIEEGVPDVDVFVPEELAARDVGFGRIFFKPIIGLLVAVANIIGLLVVGLIIFAEINSEKRSFGVLKALGFSHKRLVIGTLIQVVFLLILALPVGTLIGYGLALYINASAPLYLIRIFEPAMLAQTLFSSIIFAIIGALIPLRSIRKVDPMIVFQGAA